MTFSILAFWGKPSSKCWLRHVSCKMHQTILKRSRESFARMLRRLFSTLLSVLVALIGSEILFSRECFWNGTGYFCFKLTFIHVILFHINKCNTDSLHCPYLRKTYFILVYPLTVIDCFWCLDYFSCLVIVCMKHG